MKALRWFSAAFLVASVSISWAQCAFKTAKGNSVCGADVPVCAAPVAVEAVEAKISTDALSALLRSGVKMTVLDARSGKYDDGRRIPGAKSLASKASAAEIATVAGADKSTLIVTYCSNVKCPASKRLAGALRDLGYVNVIEYEEGIDGWAAAGKTVAKATQG